MTNLEVRRKPDAPPPGPAAPPPPPASAPPPDSAQGPPPAPRFAPEPNPARAPPSSPAVEEIAPASLDAAISGPGLVLVDFWAPWCGPCRMMAPILEEIAQGYAGRLRVVKVNTDLDRRVAGRFGISGIPTLILFRGAQIVDRVVGARPKAQIEEVLRRHL